MLCFTQSLFFGKKGVFLFLWLLGRFLGAIGGGCLVSSVAKILPHRCDSI